MIDPVLAAVPEFPRRVAFLGTPATAVPFLTALVEERFDVAHVITRIDKRRGRGSDVSPSPVKAEAQRLGVPTSSAVDDLLTQSPRVELGVVVAFGQLIKPHVLAEIPMINIHFSLLPRWRGAAPVERSLLAGDTVTGTCLMQVATGLDTGDVYDVREVAIGASWTADELRSALVELGVAQLIAGLRGGLHKPRPQVGTPTYAHKIDPGELEVDWAARAVAIDRLVRLGGAWTMFRGRRLKIHAGTLAAVGFAPTVVQPEGKGRMTIKDWVNGARPSPGELGTAVLP